MLDEIWMMHSSLWAVRTGSDSSASAQVSHREEITLLFLFIVKYFNFGRNVLGLVLIGNHSRIKIVNKSHISIDFPMLKLASIRGGKKKNLCNHEVTDWYVEIVPHA